MWVESISKKKGERLGELSSWREQSPREMKAGMSDDAGLFIKAVEAPVSLIDQALNVLSSHTSKQTVQS